MIRPGGQFNASAFSPDGQLIGAAGKDGRALLLDARTGDVVHVFRGHTNSVTGIAFSSDGRLVVTSSLDDDARIWDVATGDLAEVLHGNYGPVSAASFSPNGRWVVTAGPASAGIWDVSSGDAIVFLRGHTGPLTAASFSPDGTRILTAGLDGTARLYTCEACGDFDQLVAAAAARLAAISGRLTPAQRARFVPGTDGADYHGLGPVLATPPTIRAWCRSGVALLPSWPGRLDVGKCGTARAEGRRAVGARLRSSRRARLREAPRHCASSPLREA